MQEYLLKPKFKIGAASAATQIEGGTLDHSWMDWHRQEKIADGSSPARANEHYVRWEEDAALMHETGMQICRIGIEWARIEPREGEFDQEAIGHYVAEVKQLRAYEIMPLVTLHHFTNPMWFENMGAFEKAENIRYYLRFAKKMVAEFGGLVNEYITINEPNVYATNGYFFGVWPPGGTSFFKAVRVMSVMASAHIQAYKMIHTMRREMGFDDTKISFANHMRVFDPENPKKIGHRCYAKLTERFFQGSLSKAMMIGQFCWPVRNLGRFKKDRYCDFIAVNYYTRSAVSGFRDGVQRGVPVNDLGWEIYPEGIAKCTAALHNICPLPVYITENGTCDNTDAFRSRYIYEHLKALDDSALPIERYYHWCFCDNFEWVEGESARFGIVHIDYETQRRTVKQSGLFLRDVIKNGGVSEDIYERYVKGQEYPVNC